MSAAHSVDLGPSATITTSTIHRGLDQRHREQLFCISSVQTCRAKAVIFHEGDRSKHLFEVLDGVVKLYRLLPDGRRQITGFVYPGQVFGLDRSHVHTATAEAIVDARLCGYPLAKLELITEELPEFALGLLRMITNELAAAHDHMLLLGRKSATEKISSFPLGLSDRCRDEGEDSMMLHLPMNRANIGDYLGLAIETVSRTMTWLRQIGVIELHQRHDLRILDHDRLSVLAEEDASILAV
ncbi:MAG: cyclic nucleotide-binding domain-containing protein [Alphaproteobacteria bacterium]|nr:cyclic nucleotide-binding domain-containing protein [Alphaproteobacteria bacterium]